MLPDLSSLMPFSQRGHVRDDLLEAVEVMATKFGLESVSIRGCAKLLGVAPSAAFKHYRDKRALLTAFATKAMHAMADNMQAAAQDAPPDRAFLAVGRAYVRFALDKPAMFQAMWRRESLDISDAAYRAAMLRLAALLSSGFAQSLEDDDPASLSDAELLAWSCVHGLASLFTDGPLCQLIPADQRQARVTALLERLGPALDEA